MKKLIFLTIIFVLIVFVLIACDNINDTSSENNSDEISKIVDSDQSENNNFSSEGLPLSTSVESLPLSSSDNSSTHEESSVPNEIFFPETSDEEGYFCGYEIERQLAGGKFVSVKREDGKIALLNNERKLIFDFSPRNYIERDDYILSFYNHLADYSGIDNCAKNEAVLDLSGNFIIPFNTYTWIHYTGDFFCVKNKINEKCILLEKNGDVFETNLQFDTYRTNYNKSLNLINEESEYLAYVDFETGKLTIKKINYEQFAIDNFEKFETLFYKFIDAVKNKNMVDLKKICGNEMYNQYYNNIVNKIVEFNSVEYIKGKILSTPFIDNLFNPENYYNQIIHINDEKNGTTIIKIFWSNPDEYPQYWFLHFITKEDGSVVINEFEFDDS